MSDSGILFVSELHPFKQYDGKKAVFHSGDTKKAYINNISDFLDASEKSNLVLLRLKE